VIAPQSQQSVRNEARAWIVRLKDAHSSEDRKAFEEWLAADPAHREAYQKVAASYDASGILRTSAIGRGRDLDTAFSRPKSSFVRGLAIASLAALAVVGSYQILRSSGGFGPVALETVMLSSGPDGRTVTLSDGSEMAMAPLTQVQVELGKEERIARLRKGRIRLVVSAGTRPFRIVAGRSVAQANAGSFDASLEGDEGRVVRLPDHAAAGTPGYGKSGSAQAQSASSPMLELKAERLGEAVRQVNALRLGDPLELDPSLADRRVSGLFQQGSSNDIAQALAAAFDLQVGRTATGSLRLTPRK